jgi:hypothetical protein
VFIFLKRFMMGSLGSISFAVRFNIGDLLGEVAGFLSGMVGDFVELGGVDL